MEKTRLDAAVFERGYCESRERAKALIMEGLVYVNNQKADKPGVMLVPGDVLEVRGGGLKYVSRGGLKLEKALDVFGVKLAGAVACDVGASTGGFTDCMLQSGAKRVYAVDVGYGQLAWKLRSDPRVVNLERTNFRFITKEQIPEGLDFASVDVSFISLSLILPVLAGFLREAGEAVCLIKPQFEAGREKVGKKGVVRDPAVHEEVLTRVCGESGTFGYALLGLDYSPVRGPQGNIEYLAHLKKGAAQPFSPDIPALVQKSHEAL